MSLKVQIQDDMKSAMKAGEKDRLKVVRLILAAIKQQEVDTRKDMSDGDVLTTLNKMMKQRRDSVTQFSDGGRQDLVDIELAEIVILEEYLPEPLSDAELDALVAQAIVESGAESIRDMGKVMGLVKGRAQGRADMGAVGAKVKSRLA
jgi:uncharacterized protein YqeY